jgi:lipopolysaccharide transport system ATP-binding protein
LRGGSGPSAREKAGVRVSGPAIRVEGLGKCYRIGQREQYGALRDSLADLVAAPVRRLRTGRASPDASTIWALKDVSLEVDQGEVVGVIGRNGAGKSTLLKVLSRITEPTEGRVELRGRVGSLLEVGTGFHPELTGRENIYLNGAILGMKKAEVDRAFDAIVAFAEVDQFIDTPVKRYSSGMYLRLAFAVAAHLEPEILLVDEVLAVGDAAFQRKCLGKIGDVARAGRTVLFVSHNMPAVEKLCQRAIVVDGGRVRKDGPSAECISFYLGGAGVPAEGTIDLASQPRPDTRLTPTLTALSLVGADGRPTSTVGAGDPLEFHLSYAAPADIGSPSFSVIVLDALGAPLFQLQTRAQLGPIERAPARGTWVCRLARVPLVPGSYGLTVGCSSNERQLDLLEQVASFSVEPRDYFGTGYLPHHGNGSLLVESDWRLL